METSGNTVLITGGSSGIGLALARTFAQLDNKVIVTGRDETRLQKVQAAYGFTDIFCGDLSNQSTVDALVAMIGERYPELNILINNAAVQFNYAFIGEADVYSKVDYEIATNLSAPIKMTAGFLPLLCTQAAAAVVNVSSGLFIAPKKSASVYCATKAAIHSYSKTLRYQLEPTNIKVFEIVPPLVDTPMTEGRGKSKITSEQLAQAFLKDFRNNRYESYIGKSRLLLWISRLMPRMAERIMKNGL